MPSVGSHMHWPRKAFAQVGTTANRPGNTFAGILYYDTDDAALIVHNGTDWESVSTGGGGGSSSIVDAKAPPLGYTAVVADGTTDDAPAIQALLDARLGPVLLPPGGIMLKSTLILGDRGGFPKSGSALVGAAPADAYASNAWQTGTILLWDGTVGDPMIEFRGNNHLLRNLLVIGGTNESDASTAGAGLNITGAQDGLASGRSSVENVHFRNLDQGIYANAQRELFNDGNVSMTGTTITTDSFESGTAQAGAATTITLAAGASASNDFYNNDVVKITGGTGSGQQKEITDYNGTTKVATVETAWATNPDNTSTYTIHEKFPDDVNGTRTSGNAFPNATITIESTEYTISSRDSDTQLTATATGTHTAQTHELIWYSESNSANVTFYNVTFRDCADCFLCDNTQGYRYEFFGTGVYGSGTVNNVFNVQGGGGLQVYGATVSDSGVTLLKLGEGQTSRLANYVLEGVCVDAQATSFTWLDDDATNRTFITFRSCGTAQAVGDTTLDVDRDNTQAGPHIVFEDCHVFSSASWTLNGPSGAEPIILQSRNTPINPENITGDNYLIEASGADSQGISAYHREITLAGTATPSVANGYNFVVTGTTAITDFTGPAYTATDSNRNAMDGRVIGVRGNGSVAITHNATGPIRLRSGVSVTPTANQVVWLQYRTIPTDTGVWFEHDGTQQSAFVADATAGSAAEINAVRDALVNAGLMAAS